MFSPEKYRSVTWLKGGRVYPQLDCFGIINEIRKDQSLTEAEKNSIINSANQEVQIKKMVEGI